MLTGTWGWSRLESLESTEAAGAGECSVTRLSDASEIGYYYNSFRWSFGGARRVRSELFQGSAKCFAGTLRTGDDDSETSA